MIKNNNDTYHNDYVCDDNYKKNGNNYNNNKTGCNDDTYHNYICDDNDKK